MYQFIKKVVNFLLPGLVTSIILLSPLIYREVELAKLPAPDLVGNLIKSDETVYYQGNQETQMRCEVDELTWLACGIYFEARNQSVDGQYAVAQVILNRVEDPRWPNTIEAVVRQGEEKRNRCQFSFMCDGKAERIKNEAAWKLALEVATLALEDYYDGGASTCAHSYHANYVTSKPALKWFASLEVSETVGDHTFFCDDAN